MFVVLALAVLWITIVAAIFSAPTIPRVWRGIVGGLLIAYGVASAFTIGSSWIANNRLFVDVAERQRAADAHLREILAEAPDSLEQRELVVEARKFAERIARSSEASGPGVWKIVWKAGIFPVFEATALAEHLRQVVGVPPLLVWADWQYCIHYNDGDSCATENSDAYPIGMSVTWQFVNTLFAIDKDLRTGAIAMMNEIVLGSADYSDPRSPGRRLADVANRIVGVHAKLDEILALSCGAFDYLLRLRVVRSYEAPDANPGEWAPLSALFVDMEQLSPVLTGVSYIDVRWMGDPPRPIIGSPDANYRLDCALEGVWPEGIASWTDSTGGGTTYSVGPNTANFYQPGYTMVKWPQQPDFRTVPQDAGRAREFYLPGVPVVSVPDALFNPPGGQGMTR